MICMYFSFLLYYYYFTKFVEQCRVCEVTHILALFLYMYTPVNDFVSSLSRRAFYIDSLAFYTYSPSLLSCHHPSQHKYWARGKGDNIKRVYDPHIGVTLFFVIIVGRGGIGKITSWDVCACVYMYVNVCGKTNIVHDCFIWLYSTRGDKITYVFFQFNNFKSLNHGQGLFLLGWGIYLYSWEISYNKMFTSKLL